MKQPGNRRAVGWKAFLLTLALGPAAPAAMSADQAGGPAGPESQSAAEALVLTESQREAAALFKGMAGYIAGLQSFSVAFRAGYDVVQPSGQKIEFGETRRFTVSRPDRLRVEQVASDGKRDLAIFDGRNISVLDADAGVFAQVPQPGTLDDALAYFVRDLKMRMPLALLLTTRFPEVLSSRVRTIDYVEDTEILGVATHHIAGRTDSVDFQFWIRDGARPLPLRVVITYVDSPGQPQFWASFAEWNESPGIDATTFQFVPPANARQIAFAVQFRRPDGTEQPPAANGGLQP